MSHPQDTQKQHVAQYGVIAFRPAILWFALIALCCLLWEIDHGNIFATLVAILGFPILAVANLIGAVRAIVFRKWRHLLSILLAPCLGIGVLGMIANGLIDLDSIHFFVVKYPHELELHLLRSDRRAFRSWSWGLDAAPLAPGVAYNLVYDATGQVVRERELRKGNSIYARPMGGNFYLLAEAEDNDDVCPQMSDLGELLRRLSFGSDKVDDEWRHNCELMSGIRSPLPCKTPGSTD